MPKLQFVSHARPSQFAYPAPLPAPTTEKVEKTATAVLSTTNKARARAHRAEKERERARGSSGAAMDVEPATPVPSTPVTDKVPSPRPRVLSVHACVPHKSR
jgi:26S proteasome regulatory subunit N2